MAKTRKPRLKNLPKRPKANASLEAWEKYSKNAKEIQKSNRKLVVDFDKALKAFETARNSKKKIINATKGLGKV